MIDDEFGRYRAHIVRKHKASAGQLDMLSQVTSDRIMIFCDYKQKVLPRKWREAQSETFGKKGKSLCGVAVVFKLPPGFEGEVPKGIDREGDFAISYTRVACDDSDQDYIHSVQCFDTAIQLFKKQYPWVKEGLLYTDGAGNFRSLTFEIKMAQAAAAAGIKILAHLLPEAGDGKDRCDRDFAGVNALFNSWLKSPGASLQNAEEIVQALEAGRREGDGVTNCAIVVNRPSDAAAVTSSFKTKVFSDKVGKARDNMYYTEFHYSEDSVTGVLQLEHLSCFAYYKFGDGVKVSKEDMCAIWGKLPETSADSHWLQPQIIAPENLLSRTVVAKRVKMEKSKSNKKKAKEAKEAKLAEEKRNAAAAIKSAQDEAEAHRTSYRCFRCDKAFITELWRDAHFKSRCKGKKLTVADRQAEALRTETFQSMLGAKLDLLQPGEVSSRLTTRICLQHVPKVLEACKCVFAKGWATKEKCRRHSHICIL